MTVWGSRCCCIIYDRSSTYSSFLLLFAVNFSVKIYSTTCFVERTRVPGWKPIGRSKTFLRHLLRVGDVIKINFLVRLFRVNRNLARPTFVLLHSTKIDEDFNWVLSKASTMQPKVLRNIFLNNHKKQFDFIRWFVILQLCERVVGKKFFS